MKETVVWPSRSTSTSLCLSIMRDCQSVAPSKQDMQKALAGRIPPAYFVSACGQLPDLFRGQNAQLRFFRPEEQLQSDCQIELAVLYRAPTQASLCSTEFGEAGEERGSVYRWPRTHEVSITCTRT